MNASGNEIIVYVTRDIERALGFVPNERYYVITNRTPYCEMVKKQHPDHVILIDSPTGEALGTGDLLRHPETAKFMLDHRSPAGAYPYVLVFKNTARIEPLAKERGWLILNPPAASADRIENKVSQIAWLGDLGHYLPPHRIEIAHNIRWDGKPFVIQWAHGHTGAGTILVHSEAELIALKEKFPERRARLTSFIQGASYTVNVVAAPDAILVGNTSYQITGMSPFTDNSFSTVGNDWGLAHRLLTPADRQSLDAMIRDIGAHMQRDCWRGLFGIDVMHDSATGKMYLIEINARQPASATFESALQESRRTQGAEGMTIFEAHIAALLGKPLGRGLIRIEDGAQIIQRVTKSVESVPEEALGELGLSGYDVIAYPNTEENADLIRIQSRNSFMAAHNEFNESGLAIRDALTR